ncbi:hypothetical protein CEXT_516161 [Caerostris extrusa]|uniref:Uncharacterized protein n=1 Tax=Caerostris extrusa TaxID=172846 RepID=A0AAV4NCW7_CAEEX|nr:hypothetical protein CEXT_516161 [Caerostris extrusa]
MIPTFHQRNTNRGVPLSKGMGGIYCKNHCYYLKLFDFCSLVTLNLLYSMSKKLLWTVKYNFLEALDCRFIFVENLNANSLKVIAQYRFTTRRNTPTFGEIHLCRDFYGGSTSCIL